MLTIFTEEFPPFNYTENKEIVGMSTQVVTAVMKDTGLDYVIKSYPWARTYAYAKSQPNALIYSISRRAKREKDFQWIGVIVPSVQSAFALRTRTDIRVTSLEDLKNYETGTTIGDARETYLVNNGFRLDKFQRIAGDDSYAINFKKLQKGRIDIWPIPDAVAYYVARKAGEAPGKILKKVYEFSEISQGGYYIAASLNTPSEIVKSIKTSLEAFKTSPAYSVILEQWGVKRN